MGGSHYPLYACERISKAAPGGRRHRRRPSRPSKAYLGRPLRRGLLPIPPNLSVQTSFKRYTPSRRRTDLAGIESSRSHARCRWPTAPRCHRRSVPSRKRPTSGRAKRRASGSLVRTCSLPLEKCISARPGRRAMPSGWRLSFSGASVVISPQINRRQGLRLARIST